MTPPDTNTGNRIISKPRVGQRLYYQPKAVGAPFASRPITVTKFDGNLMHYREDSGNDSLIIWISSEGLNPCLSCLESKAS